MSDLPVKKITTPSGSDSVKDHSPRGQVVIFGMWCKGCGLCVEFCPVDVLAIGDDDRPMVIHPERCTACHWCDTHCPDLAIVVKRLKPEEE